MDYKLKYKKLSWVCISEHQILSEKFIREFQDKVNWNLIRSMTVK